MGRGAGRDPRQAAVPLGSVRSIQVGVNRSAAVIFALIVFGLAAWQSRGQPAAVHAHVRYGGRRDHRRVLALLLAHEVTHSLVHAITGLG
jgi:hypothetical protein